MTLQEKLYLYTVGKINEDEDIKKIIKVLNKYGKNTNRCSRGSK